MATITSLGVGSGLDLESLVSKLMSAEQAPLTAIQKKQTSTNTKISSLGTLKSKLAAIQSAANALKADIGKSALEKFATYSATSSTSTVASATVGTGAIAGNYDLVVSKLAQAQRFTSAVFADSNTAVGEIGDTLTFSFATPDAEGNSRNKTITLDSTNNTLAGLRNSINGKNMGVTASIINGSAGAQLVITGQEGLDNEITLGGNIQLAPDFTSSLTYPAPTTLIGTDGDTLTLSFGTPADPLRTTTITLNSGNNTLAGLRDAINAADTGVNASIKQEGSAYRLVLNGERGTTNKLSVSGTGTLAIAFTNTSAASTQTTAAQDAEFTVNGIAATSSTNTASKALDGVTLKLSTTGNTTLNIASDYAEKMTASLNSFITAYNAGNESMKTMGAYNATTKVAGALQGNSLLRDAHMQIRNLVFDTTTGGSSSYQRLSDLGVSVGTDGSLSLNSTKLNTALSADPTAAASLLSKIGTEFSKTIEKFVSFSGKIQTATESSNKFLKELTNRSEVLMRRLDTVEARYRKQFSAMDTLVSKLNSTSSYLATQLANLSN